MLFVKHFINDAFKEVTKDYPSQRSSDMQIDIGFSIILTNI